MFYKIIDDYLIKGFDHRGRVIEVKVKGLVTQVRCGHSQFNHNVIII